MIRSFCDRVIVRECAIGLAKEPACMMRPHSNDLRSLVVTAVVDRSTYRWNAAKRFGIALSTAIKWVSA